MKEAGGGVGLFQRMQLLHVGAGVAAVVPQPGRSHGETATSVLGRTWSWKDDLHFEQQLYYGKIITGQPSFLAPDYLPDFISALAGRDLEHERDVTRLYFDGRLSGEARLSTTGCSIIPRSRRGNCDVAPDWAPHRRSWQPNTHWWNCNAAS